MRLFSSYGHPVPRVAGRNQKGGRTAAARILRTAFSDERDVIEMDITAAYDVPGLRSLVRTFEFVRGPNAALVITDAWASDAPLDFETAITTRSAWRCDGPLALTLDAGERRSVAVTIEAPENRIEISSETIEEDCVPFTRIALRTVRPFPQGIVVVRCSPKLTE